jgi:putative proteasome-type protease
LKLEADSPLLKQMSQSWNLGIRNAFDNLPRFDWELSQPAPGQPVG